MTTVQKIIVGAGVVVALGAVVAVSLLGKDKEKGEEVYMAKAAKKTVVSAVSANGLIQPRTKVNVQSSVIGEIVALPVKEGQRVKKGDLLVQIDPQRYRSEVDRLQANLRMSRIGIEQQEVALANAQRILKRYDDLRSRGLVSPEAQEKTELDSRLAEINLKSLKEQVDQADAALAIASDQLQKTTIRTPIDGVVTKLNAELGEMTMTGTMNNPGTVIMIVSDLSEILAEVDVDETRIVKVRPGQTARVVVDAVGELHPYQGTVTEIASTAVKKAGQEVQVFLVKVALDRPDDRLRPGMTAKARIETERADDAITVPIQAVLLKPAKEVAKILADREAKAGRHEPAKAEAPAPSSAAGKDAPAEEKREIVYTVVSGKAVLTPVRTGMSDETDAAILEGVAEGDTVVTGPYRAVKTLKDQDAVKTKQDKPGDDKESKDTNESKSGGSSSGGVD